jgi:hypothetical protein
MSALAVDMDISIAVKSAPVSGAMVRIWGVGIADMMAAQTLMNKPISVSAGMAKGLPLANPAQYGLLADGTIFQAYGNWIATDQNLTILFTPGPTSMPETGGPDPAIPSSKIVFNCPKGGNLLQSAVQALQNAFPGYTVSTAAVAKGQGFTSQAALQHYSRTLEDFSNYLVRLSQSPQFGGIAYQGITIFARRGTISLVDGPGSNNIAILGSDLIGQPTWIDPLTIQVKTVMRGDIVPWENTITLPNTWINASGGGSSLFFPTPIMAQGTNLQVIRARHVGSSRQPAGEAWISIFDVCQLGATNLNQDNGAGTQEDDGE